MPGSNLVIANMYAIMKAKVKASEAIMDKHIRSSEEYARSNHPWDDKTGSATEGLRGVTKSDGNEVVSVIGHHVTHGIYLEQRQDYHGRYQVLERARNHNLEKMMMELRLVWGGRL